MYEKRKVAFRHFLSAGFTHVNLRVIHTEHWTSSRRANTLKIRSPHSSLSLEYGALRIFWFSKPDTHKANFCKQHTFWTGLGFYEECVSRTACARFCFCVCAHVCVFFCACVCVWKYCSAQWVPCFQIKSTAVGWSKLQVESSCSSQAPALIPDNRGRAANLEHVSTSQTVQYAADPPCKDEILSP